MGPSGDTGSLLKELGSLHVWKRSRLETLKGQRTFSRWDVAIENGLLAVRDLPLEFERLCRESPRPLQRSASRLKAGAVPWVDLEPFVVDVRAWTCPGSLCLVAASTLETSGSQLWLVSSL